MEANLEKAQAELEAAKAALRAVPGYEGFMSGEPASEEFRLALRAVGDANERLVEVRFTLLLTEDCF